MDPKTSFLLDIHLKANPRICRKDIPCYRFSKVVDSDLCNFKDFVREIVDQFPHGYQEIVHVFYYDDVKKYSEVRTDQELLAMFSKHVDSKKVRMTITYTEPRDVPIAECCHPEISAGLDIPCTPSLAAPSLGAASQSTEHVSSQHSKPTTSKQPVEPSDEPDDDDGCLPNPKPHKEHVGVHDEGVYYAAPKTHVEGGGLGAQSESDSESGSESDKEYEEEDGLIGKDPVLPKPNVAYDPNDPPMSVGSLYPNISQFRLALSQHAIKNEFEYNTEKSDPERLRAYCSKKEEEGCKWRLHASTYRDGVTIKVIGYSCQL